MMSRPEDQQIHTSTLALLHTRTPAILIANLINSTLTVVVLQSAVGRRLLATWLAVFLLTLAVRGALWLRFRDQGQADWPVKWGRTAEIGSYTGGLMWGVAGFAFFVPGSPLHLAMLVFVLGGMAAGALTTLSAYPRALNGYLLLSLTPFCVRLATEGGVDGLVMAGMAGLFTVCLLVIGQQTHKFIAQTFALRFENRQLIRSLEQRVDDRTRRHAAVVEFSHRALSGLDTDSLLHQAASIVADGLPATSAQISEWEPESDTLSIRAAAGRDTGTVGQVLEPSDPTSPARHALKTGQPVISGDLGSDTRFTVPPVLRDLGVASTISVPIWGHERPFGVLEAWNSDARSAAADDVNFLRAVATTVATALERRRAEEGLQQLALHDLLTGLPNRVLFRDQLDRAARTANRSGQYGALLLIDIDHFKDVNDTLGHAAGDQLLSKVAQRMRDCTRREEPPARLGGDEFGIVLTGLTSPDGAATVAEKLVSVLNEPVSLAGHDIHIGASVGITIFPVDGGDPDNLLRNADLALYRAKAQGRGAYAFYALDMARDVQNRLELLHDLRGALDKGELHLEYQPQVALQSGRITGVESLLRWTSPRRGVVGPDIFIPLAETSSLMIPLGDWTMRHACAQAQAWFTSGLPKITVALNISLAQWRRMTTAEVIASVLSTCSFESRYLELEITERAFPLADDKRFLEWLRQEGVSISIDDFGTGHSNLTRLRQLPVDKIKIDGSFIAGLGRDATAEKIVRAIIALSRGLGLQVVAEGVEQQLQLDFLRVEGCDVAQGYFLGRPMRPEHIATLLNDSGAPC
jgi:diguanylate cyclase (GGDEF)-like protein